MLGPKLTGTPSEVPVEFSSTDTVFETWLATTTSVRLSPFRSPTATDWGSVPVAKSAFGAKTARSVAAEHRHAVAVAVGGDQVRAVVDVRLADRHRGGPVAGGEVDVRPEAARPVAECHGNGVRDLARGNKVEPAVPVQIPDCYR